jgi:hypothetical protein
MRQGFTAINIHPVQFDPDRVDVGQQLVGVAFALEPHEDGIAIVVKASDNAHAFDPLHDRVVMVPPNYAVRVVARGALQRLVGKILNPDTGARRDVLPHLCFEVARVNGKRTLVVGEAINAGVPSHAFVEPQLLDSAALIVVTPPAEVQPAAPATA